MKTSTKVILGLGAVATGGILFALLRRRYTPDPSQWQLPAFNLDMTSPTDWSMPEFGSDPDEWSMPSMPEAKGIPQVEVAPIGVPCRSSANCGAGLICINGSCRPDSEWG